MKRQQDIYHHCYDLSWCWRSAKTEL